METTLDGVSVVRRLSGDATIETSDRRVNQLHSYHTSIDSDISHCALKSVKQATMKKKGKE